MKKEELKIFKEFCLSYANRFIDTVCSNTCESWLPIFARNRWWRCKMELEEKKELVIKNADEDTYKIYEGIMIEVLSKKIENDKVIANKKAKEKLKKEKEKKIKGKK